MKIFNLLSFFLTNRISRYRIRLNKRAVSNVVSTVILTSAMICIAILVMGFASNIFAVQSDSVEFDQAKNTIINFAGIIEQVSSKQGSSGYVLFNPRSGGLGLSIGGNIAVSFCNTYLSSVSGDFNTLKYRGGSLSSVAPNSPPLRGTNETYTYNNNSTLGSVYVEQVNGSWVILDYARIGILNLGTFTFSTGIVDDILTNETVNLIQVQYINFTKGTFSGSGSIHVIATCKNVNVSYMRFDNTQEPDFIVELTIGGSVTTKHIPVPDIDRSKDIIVMTVRSDVEISMLGG